MVEKFYFQQDLKFKLIILFISLMLVLRMVEYSSSSSKDHQKGVHLSGSAGEKLHNK